MLLALVLVIGLALASSSMMSLNLSRQTYLETRCGMLARSGVNEVIARLIKAEASHDIQLFNPKPLDLRELFPGRTEIVPGCWITFDPAEPGYSTDNMLGENKAAGWLDRGRATKSVPAFNLELLLHARQGAHERTYRALVRRTWPYAVYSGGGPVVLSGDPQPNLDANKGSHVHGRIYSSVRPELDFRFESRDETPRALLFNMLTAGLRPERNYDVPLQVGPPLVHKVGVHSPIGEPNPARAEDAFTRYLIRDIKVEASELVQTEGNTVLGSVEYTDKSKVHDRQVQVTRGNRFQGRVRYRELPLRRNPLSNLKPGTGEGYSAWTPNGRSFLTAPIPILWNAMTMEVRTIQDHLVFHWPPKAEEAARVPRDDFHPSPNWVIWGKHRLAGTPSSPNYYCVNGSLVNRVVGHGMKKMPSGWVPAEGIPVDEYGFELQLEDCLLHVKGDLDLCDISGRDPLIKGISGNGATLVVEGTLAITGASIRAGDRGMVIYAPTIMLAGSGDFSGLLVASSSISIVPQPGKRIKIRGGVVTSGGISSVEGKPGVALHNVDVVYDPRYLKSLSMCGDYELTVWEPL